MKLYKGMYGNTLPSTTELICKVKQIKVHRGSLSSAQDKLF